MATIWKEKEIAKILQNNSTVFYNVILKNCQQFSESENWVKNDLERRKFVQITFFSPYLVKCWEDVVGELNLRDGRGPPVGHPDPEPGDALLAQRGVEHAVVAVLLLKGKNIK